MSPFLVVKIEMIRNYDKARLLHVAFDKRRHTSVNYATTSRTPRFTPAAMYGFIVHPVKSGIISSVQRLLSLMNRPEDHKIYVNI